MVEGSMEEVSISTTTKSPKKGHKVTKSLNEIENTAESLPVPEIGKNKGVKKIKVKSAVAGKNNDVTKDIEVSGSGKAPESEGQGVKGKGEPKDDNHDPKKAALKSKKRRKKKNANPIGNTALGADVGGFTVIGDVDQFRTTTVKRVLPDWLAHPSVVSCDLKDNTAPVNGFNLDSHLVKLLEKNFVSYFFPVQQQVIPWLLDAHSPKLFRPSDICVSAPTGSGKTLAYALPIIQILKKSMSSSVRAIVVLPTEILASQVCAVFQTYSKGTNVKVFLMTKKLSLSAETKALIKIDLNGKRECPYDVIIATPGRLIDHLEQTDGFEINNLKFLVVDEADRTLDDQENEWLQRLEVKFWSYHKTPETLQPWKSLPLNMKSMPTHLKAFHKLLFSATLSQNPETLEKLHLFQPKLFTSIVQKKSKENSDSTNAKNPEEQEFNPDSFVGKFTTPSELKESFVLVKKETKPLVLSYLMSHNKWKRVLCFANTNEATHRLCLLLNFMGDFKVREISSKWSPHARDIVIKQFIQGKIDILITSDQLARGIDIAQVDYVISYDVPGYTKTYVHRIGRTARGGREGSAITLVTKEQLGIYHKTIKSAGKTRVEKLHVKNSDLRPFEAKFKQALIALKSKVEEEAVTATEKLHGKKFRKRPAPSSLPDTTSGSAQTTTEVTTKTVMQEEGTIGKEPDSGESPTKKKKKKSSKQEEN